jgi:hypothetical protein
VITVNVVQNGADLLLSEVIPEGLHCGSKFLGRNGTRSIFVKEVESLLVLGGFLGGKVLAHFLMDI